MALNPDLSNVLNEILGGLKKLREEHNQLASAVDAISGKVNVLASVKKAREGAAEDSKSKSGREADHPRSTNVNTAPEVAEERRLSSASVASASNGSARRGSLTSKITLTSYPGQSGVDPIDLSWGHLDPIVRGPIIVGRGPTTLRRRNGS